jgi:hypothetical protein
MWSSFNSNGAFGRQYELFVTSSTFSFYRKNSYVLDFGGQIPEEFCGGFEIPPETLEYILNQAEDKIRILNFEVINNR